MADCTVDFSGRWARGDAHPTQSRACGRRPCGRVSTLRCRGVEGVERCDRGGGDGDGFANRVRGAGTRPESSNQQLKKGRDVAYVRGEGPAERQGGDVCVYVHSAGHESIIDVERAYGRRWVPTQMVPPVRLATPAPLRRHRWQFIGSGSVAMAR